MPTSIRLPTDIEHRLDELAEKTGRSKAYYLREIIIGGIEDMEDYYLGLEALERVRKGESTILASQLRKELGLDN